MNTLHYESLVGFPDGRRRLHIHRTVIPDTASHPPSQHDHAAEEVLAPRAAESATASQRARLEFFGDHLALMQRQLRAQGFLPELKDSPLHRTDAAVDAMLGRVHPGFGVAFAPGMKRDAKTISPLKPAVPPIPHP